MGALPSRSSASSGENTHTHTHTPNIKQTAMNTIIRCQNVIKVEKGKDEL